MGAIRQGSVKEVISAAPDIVHAKVLLGEEEIEAAGFPNMLGPVSAGDRVIVNTTGIELGLGTGGVGFILWNLDGPGEVDPGDGHIVKLRYTPWQTEVMAAEAPESPHHAALESAVDLEGMPVVVCGLHSQLGAAAAGVKAVAPDARVGYLMTDAAALPLAWSRSVKALKSAGLVDVTCSAGHAFGGDLEAVNVFSGLLALKVAGRADVAVVAMGPGVVGTDTALGFSAMEQGQVLDAVTALGGRAIAALRISFADERSRHLGVSHHTLTSLRLAARERCSIAVPLLPDEHAERVRAQLQGLERHELVEVDGGPGLRLLGERGLRPSSMGRSADEVPELFVAAAAAGVLAGEALQV
jgi:hypothetical protein